jgi:hypothetical protein
VRHIKKGRRELHIYGRVLSCRTYMIIDQTMPVCMILWPADYETVSQ